MGMDRRLGEFINNDLFTELSSRTYPSQRRLFWWLAGFYRYLETLIYMNAKCLCVGRVVDRHAVEVDGGEYCPESKEQ